MTQAEEIARGLSDAGRTCVRYMAKYPDVWKGSETLPELHTAGLAGNEPGTLNPLGREVARCIEEKMG